MFKLPLVKTGEKNSLLECSFLLYGERKIGKTAVCSQFPDTLFLFTESGGSGQNTYNSFISDWIDFKEGLKQLKEDKKYKTIVIDTIDILYDLCLAYVCKKLVITHPSEEGYGKGWEAVKKEFKTEIGKVLSLRKGIWFLSHADYKDIKFLTESGIEETKKISPTLSKQAFDCIASPVDQIIFYGFHKNKRTFFLQGSNNLEAGGRLNGKRYLDAKTRKPLTFVSGGANENIAYNNLVSAFNNEYFMEEKINEVKKSLLVKKSLR